MISRCVTPLVARLLAVYPDLVVDSARLVEGHGQNNEIVILNERLVFRFPRYLEGIGRLEKTIQILQAIRPGLPVEIPNPVYSSLDERVVGKVFVGYPMLQGEPLWDETFECLPDEASKQRLVDQLADILRALHRFPIQDVLPDEGEAFDPLAEWTDLYRRIRDRLFPAMRSDARDAVARHFESFLSDPSNRSIRPALVHGDFGTSNILFDPTTGVVSGVVDFDAAGVGDPAVDLAAASCYGLPRFRRRYPEVGTMTDRITFYRGTFALQEALFGAEHGDDEAYRSGMAGYW